MSSMHDLKNLTRMVGNARRALMRNKEILKCFGSTDKQIAVQLEKAYGFSAMQRNNGKFYRDLVVSHMRGLDKTKKPGSVNQSGSGSSDEPKSCSPGFTRFYTKFLKGEFRKGVPLAQAHRIATTHPALRGKNALGALITIHQAGGRYPLYNEGGIRQSFDQLAQAILTAAKNPDWITMEEGERDMIRKGLYGNEIPEEMRHKLTGGRTHDDDPAPDGVVYDESANARQVAGTHYIQFGEMQHWDMCSHFQLDYFQGQITKYVMRWKQKNGLEDLKKAAHFLQKYIEEQEKFLQKGRST